MLIDYEEIDGRILNLPMLEVMNKLIDSTSERLALPFQVFFPETLGYCIMPSDRRYARNCNRFRALLQNVIDERR